MKILILLFIFSYSYAVNLEELEDSVPPLSMVTQGDPNLLEQSLKFPMDHDFWPFFKKKNYLQLVELFRFMGPEGKYFFIGNGNYPLYLMSLGLFDETPLRNKIEFLPISRDLMKSDRLDKFLNENLKEVTDQKIFVIDSVSDTYSPNGHSIYKLYLKIRDYFQNKKNVYPIGIWEDCSASMPHSYYVNNVPDFDKYKKSLEQLQYIKAPLKFVDEIPQIGYSCDRFNQFPNPSPSKYCKNFWTGKSIFSNDFSKFAIVDDQNKAQPRYNFRTITSLYPKTAELLKSYRAQLVLFYQDLFFYGKAITQEADVFPIVKKVSNQNNAYENFMNYWGGFLGETSHPELYRFNHPLFGYQKDSEGNHLGNSAIPNYRDDTKLLLYFENSNFKKVDELIERNPYLLRTLNSKSQNIFPKMLEGYNTNARYLHQKYIQSKAALPALILKGEKNYFSEVLKKRRKIKEDPTSFHDYYFFPMLIQSFKRNSIDQEGSNLLHVLFKNFSQDPHLLQDFDYVLYWFYKSEFVRDLFSQSNIYGDRPLRLLINNTEFRQGLKNNNPAVINFIERIRALPGDRSFLDDSYTQLSTTDTVLNLLGVSSSIFY